jgi:hypothetical protein
MNTYRTSCSRAVAVIAATVLAVVASAGAASAQQKAPVTPTLVANIYEPGFNAYQTSHNTFMPVNTVAFTEDLPVPPGRIAVIEHVSVSGALSNGAIPRAFVRCNNAGQEVLHSLIFISEGSDSKLTTWVASQPIKCYATTATSTSSGLSIHLQTNSFQTLQPSWVVAASGFLLPE